MKLTIKERIVLPSLFPIRGDFITVEKCAEAQRLIIFTDEEMETFKLTGTPLQTGETNWSWDEEKEKEVGDKDFVFGKFVNKIIKEALKAMDRDKSLTNHYLSLYVKFVK